MDKQEAGKDFAGKVIIVTGASGGIGSAIARQFAEKNARLALHYHKNRKAAEKLRDSLPGGPHLVIQADIARAEDARNLVKGVIREMGAVDVLVNNSGVFDQHPILDLTYEEWHDAWLRTIGINLIGPALLTFCAVEHMMKGGGGRIVNVSSRGAFRGEPKAAAYGASKAGLNAMSQSLAKALAPHHIFFFVVAPGFVDTERVAPLLESPEGNDIRRDIPLGRVARPDEVARVILFLASEGSEYLTGCIVDINAASYLRS